MSKRADESWVLTILRGLQDRKFYGKIIVEMREGHIKLLRQEETLKPPGSRLRST